jgi:acyl carrier protein phosphodiesterase
LNWLAHVFLSEPNVEFQLGNLLADIVRRRHREGLPANFIRGAVRHHAIDVFTDAHPIVKRSRARMSPEYRRFSGVLMDVFYDYFLATRWIEYSSISLDEFTAQFYARAAATKITLPDDAKFTLDRIIQHDLLGQYRSVDGVRNSLRRLSMRLSARWHREFRLDASVSELIEHEEALARDFAEFLPQLQSHVANL